MSLRLSLAAAGLIVAISATNAHAGFQWIPPSQQAIAENNNAVNAVVPTPQRATPRNYLEILPYEAAAEPKQVPPYSVHVQKQREAAPQPLKAHDMAVPVEENGSIKIAPLAQAEYREMEPMRPYNGAQPTMKYEDIHGFGADIPLALALKQIIPDGFSFAFTAGVNPASMVSWQGGKAWDKVLNDVLKPAGYYAQIIKQTVYIRVLGNQKQPHSQPMAAPTKDTTSSPHPLTASKTRILVKPSAPKHVAAPKKIATANPITLIKRENSGMPSAVTPQPRHAADQLNAMQPHAGDAGNLDDGFWEAHKGQDLREVLTRWAARANIDLVWNAHQNYKIDRDLMIDDQPRYAVKTLMRNGLNASTRPAMTYIDKTSSAPAILIIRDSL